jgi:hypothetical protein
MRHQMQDASTAETPLKQLAYESHCDSKMKLRTLAVSLVAIVGASYAVACGGNADANKANLDMSAPAHDNMSPTVGDGGVVNTTTSDLAKPSHVNESPAPAGTGH